MSAWDPSQYERFRDERSKPFFDLLALVEKKPRMRVVDLGCGTGELTRAMHDALAAESTLGIDSSHTMLAKSAPFATPALRFEHADIAPFGPIDAYDLVFANASLQWVEGHRLLFARLTSALRSGGQLAVQMPSNHDHPSHVIARALADESPYKEAISASNKPPRPVLFAPEEYARLLFDLRYARQHVRLQVYAHVLASKDDVFEWVKGTMLTEFEEKLAPDLFARFRDEYRARLSRSLEDARPFLYPFKRIHIWGIRA